MNGIQRGYVAIGRSGKPAKGRGSQVEKIAPFLDLNNLKPFVPPDLEDSTKPIVFRAPTGSRAYGYRADLLPRVCDVYLKARDAGELLKSQEKMARACDLLVRALARVGIVALVDEATGYQEVREKDELVRILEAYISEELRPWVHTFPNEFFKQIYRLNKWPYNPNSSKRNQQVGHWINKYIYNQLPPGVLDDLRRKNPRKQGGYRAHKHFQQLTADIGDEHLDRLLATVTTLLRISDTKSDFEENFRKAFRPDEPRQKRLPFIVEVPDDKAAK